MVDAAIDRIAREYEAARDATPQQAIVPRATEALARPVDIKRPGRLRWKGLDVSDEFKRYAERVAQGEELPPFEGRILAAPNSKFPWEPEALRSASKRASRHQVMLWGSAAVVGGLLAWTLSMKFMNAPAQSFQPQQPPPRRSCPVARHQRRRPPSHERRPRGPTRRWARANRRLRLPTSTPRARRLRSSCPRRRSRTGPREGRERCLRRQLACPRRRPPPQHPASPSAAMPRRRRNARSPLLRSISPPRVRCAKHSARCSRHALRPKPARARRPSPPQRTRARAQCLRRLRAQARPTLELPERSPRAHHRVRDRCWWKHPLSSHDGRSPR